MKRLIVRIVLAAVVVAAFLIIWRLYRLEHLERLRLEDNQHVLLTDVEYYRTRDSLSAAGVERLTLTSREFRAYAKELEQTVESLNLKVRRLQSASRTVLATERLLETPVRDSVVIRDSLRTDTVRLVSFADPWLTFEGRLSEGRFAGRIESRDTLVQIVHRIPRKFWFIRWGTRALRQEVTARNPYSRIVYTEYIELKRSRRTNDK